MVIVAAVGSAGVHGLAATAPPLPNVVLIFTVQPEDGATIDFERLGFWGNAGAFGNTTVTLSYQLAGAAPVEAGSRRLGNLSTPRTRGEYYDFPLDSLTGVAEPVTFTLSAQRNGERVIFKIDDLRVDGVVARR
jgi:hypothetical protein